METESWRKYQNPEPPSDDFDFETTVIKEHLKSAFGDLTQFVNTEDVFYYSSGCSNFSDSSDDDTAISVPSKKSEVVVKKERLSSIASPSETICLSDEEISRKDKKRLKLSKRHSPKDWQGIEYSDSEDSYEELLEEYKNKSKIKVENKPIKVESNPIKQEREFEKRFGVYHCSVCNIELNSQVTYDAHIRGKKHIKAVNAESITNIAKLSLEPRQNEASSYITSRRPDLAAPQKKFIPVNKVSYIQELVDSYNNGPLPGLSHVVEFRTIDKRETSYYCKLCDSPCSTQSIMPHLTGYKHQLRCLEMIDRKSYDLYSYQPKKQVESKILRILLNHERDHQRELILVEEEFDNEPMDTRYDGYDQPGPSRRNESRSEPSASSSDSKMSISCVEDLDISRNDYYCLTCHSHMNNLNMWENHVRGKRHLKNKKKDTW